jgi:hypothetical protein
MRRLALLALALASVGCVTIERWERPGATEAEQRRDDAECWARAENERAVPTRRLVSRPGGGGPYETVEMVPRREFDSALYEQCLESRGYRKVPAKTGQ